MQDHIQSTSGKRFSSPHPSVSGADGMQDEILAQEMQATPSTPSSLEESPMREQSASTLRETLDEHKGKLAISAAAMLGLLVFYKWGEKSLAREDPEEYKRLRRIKEGLRHAEHGRRAGDEQTASASAKKA